MRKKFPLHSGFATLLSVNLLSRRLANVHASFALPPLLQLNTPLSIQLRCRWQLTPTHIHLQCLVNEINKGSSSAFRLSSWIVINRPDVNLRLLKTFPAAFTLTLSSPSFLSTYLAAAKRVLIRLCVYTGIGCLDCRNFATHFSHLALSACTFSFFVAVLCIFLLSRLFLVFGRGRILSCYIISFISSQCWQVT